MTTFLDRLFGRPEPARPPSAKAVTSLGPWANATPLSSFADTPQKRAAMYLRAYKVGWFHKAGRKIAGDVASLEWSLSLGDAEEGDAEAVLDKPDLTTPFESLAPIDQLQRLLERPSPNQTWRQLAHKTQVRLDFAGAACWYLAGGLLPNALYGISPARMTEARDRSGELIGWVMDKDAPSGGVPFSKEEILWFSTGNAESDEDIWGTSVVEAVYSQVPLTDAMARHTANVLSTGGRLAGMMWPKERALSEDEFMDAQRAWRNVSSDPDAGRRLLIFPEPMEYAAGASTPAEIGIPELAVLSRDEVLTAFPLSPYMLGVPTPGGLNSGEVRREDRRDYWEGTIHPRIDLLKEFIQTGLVSRYETVTGQPLDFDIEEPNLDDAPVLAEKAKAYKDLVGIGLDPKEALSAVGLDHIKWLGLPDLLDPAKQAEAAAAATEALAERPQQDAPSPKPVKAVDDDLVADTDKALRQFFREQRARVVADLERLLPTNKAVRQEKGLPGGWWDEKRENGALEAVLRSMYAETARSGLQVVADRINRVVTRNRADPVVRAVQTYGFMRLVDINERTKKAIEEQVTEGIRRGYSVTQVVEGVPAENFAGVINAPLGNGQPAFDELRAETIARTETALAYNQAALNGYKEFGITQVEAIDGDEDAECRERDGQPFSVDDALAIDEHPNGTLDWVPLL